MIQGRVACEGATGEPLTVRQTLQQLSDLNGKVVQIRGFWAIGDTGQSLWADPPCSAPTIRDGWIWKDIIEITAAKGQPSALDGGPIYRKLSKRRRLGKILAILTGRLRTRDRFEVKLMPDGSSRPLGFGYYVAHLAYTQAADLEWIPITTDEQQRLFDIGRTPYALPSVNVGNSQQLSR